MRIDTFIEELLGKEHEINEGLIKNLKEYLDSQEAASATIDLDDENDSSSPKLTEDQLLDHTNEWLKKELIMGDDSFLAMTLTLSRDKKKIKAGGLLLNSGAFSEAILGLASIARELNEKADALYNDTLVSPEKILTIGSAKVDVFLKKLKLNEAIVSDRTFLISAVGITVAMAGTVGVLAATNSSAMKTILTPITQLFHTLSKALSSNVGGAILTGVILGACIAAISGIIALSAKGIKYGQHKHGRRLFKGFKTEFSRTKNQSSDKTKNADFDSDDSDDSAKNNGSSEDNKQTPQERFDDFSQQDTSGLSNSTRSLLGLPTNSNTGQP